MRINFHLRRYFITGLLVTVPIAGTFFILKSLLTLLEGILGNALKAAFSAHYYPGLGIAVLITSIFLVGLVSANFLGNWLVVRYEQMLKKLPLVSTVYSAIKSVVHTISTQGKRNFQGVVLVEFPRRDMWVMAFVVNNTEGTLADKLTEPHLNLFMPTTPNPTSGFLLFIPEKDAIYLDIPVEEAMKTIISGGIYTPGSMAGHSGLSLNGGPSAPAGPPAA
ncbi:MAG: DUF502 domain-containing protein [Nitrospirota bacterium]|nr:DUF502 domain-containing protein [Nitrospirota bacterium]